MRVLRPTVRVYIAGPGFYPPTGLPLYKGGDGVGFSPNVSAPTTTTAAATVGFWLLADETGEWAIADDSGFWQLAAEATVSVTASASTGSWQTEGNFYWLVEAGDGQWKVENE